jgi:ribosome-binding protein aMBF1 (putative translation factor)
MQTKYEVGWDLRSAAVDSGTAQRHDARTTQSARALTGSGDHLTRIPTLRAVRLARGMSLAETARRAGMDPAHLSRVERGERQPSVDALARLAVALGLDELAKLLAPYREAL